MRSDAVAQPAPCEREKHHGRDDAGRRQGHDHQHRDQRRGRSRRDAGYIEPRQQSIRRRLMSFTLHGIAVSSGIAIGHRPTHAAPEFDAFLELHQMILDDPLLSVAPREMIASEHCNAEWALKVQTETLVAQFDKFEDAYLRERQADVKQVAERLLKQLLGQPGHPPMPAHQDVETILVAHDLSPADLIQFRPQQYAAFITDVGGATSHTAIVARSLNTPCVVGLHHARELVREDDLLILDGAQGVLIVSPDKSILAEYKLDRKS